MQESDAVKRLYQTTVSSEPEAYQMYCRYAHDAGFSVRKDHHLYWPNSKKIKLKDYVCSKAGFKRSELPSNFNCQKKYRKSDTRTGCPAMIRYTVDQDGVWSVGKIIESHNHELARPEDHHLLRSFRSIGEEKGAILKSMTNSGIRTVDAYSYLADEVGGVENIGFSKRDAYNYIQTERRSKIERGDTNSLIQEFKGREAEDNMFAWDVQTDEYGNLLNFFWVDGPGRIDYDCFGDVIIFDTSYRLNKYNLACAPIVGVNNHWQNVLLGVAFLSEETIEAFIWLFTAFLRIMGGKYPTTIFTDQDQAMSRAIEVALPQTRHRLCQWHISKKLTSKVPIISSNNELRSLFYKCMSNCDTEEEFDRAWADMVELGSLQGNNWLGDLHNLRRKWSTAFNKDCFDMGILSTQRSESTNNVCHGITKPTSTLLDCFLGMEKLMHTWRRNEQDEDFKCNQSAIVPFIKSPILKQGAKFYSQKLYQRFEKIFLQGVASMCIEQLSTDSSTFRVTGDNESGHSSTATVRYDAKENDVQCTCRKFETLGLLCCHIMRVFRQLDIVKIPEKFLFARWSARAKKDLYGGGGMRRRLNCKVEEAPPSGQLDKMIFRNRMIRFAYQIASRAQGQEVEEEYLLAGMNELSRNVDLLREGKNPTHKILKIAHAGVDMIKDPLKCRPKGISTARLKGHWEKKRKGRPKLTFSSGGADATDTSFGAGPASTSTPQNIPPSSEESRISSTPTFSAMPHCFTEAFITGGAVKETSAEYTRLMSDLSRE